MSDQEPVFGADDEVICVCNECFSEQNPNKVERSAFYREGGSPPCRYCGGTTSIIDRSEVDRHKESQLKKRGIDTTVHPK